MRDLLKERKAESTIFDIRGYLDHKHRISHIEYRAFVAFNFIQNIALSPLFFSFRRVFFPWFPD
jgi:hypothetical protein